MKPPEAIGGAAIVCYSPVDERHHFTGICKHTVAGQLMGAMAGLAVCQYAQDGGFYLFGCDADWQVVTDTWHETLADAQEQAEHEYTGITCTWTQIA